MYILLMDYGSGLALKILISESQKNLLFNRTPNPS